MGASSTVASLESTHLSCFDMYAGSFIYDSQEDITSLANDECVDCGLLGIFGRLGLCSNG